MRIIVKEVGKPAAIHTARRSNALLDQLVGGCPTTCMKSVVLRSDGERVELHAWCDDDGISKELPINFARPTDGAPIHGTVVITGMAFFKGGPDWSGLSAGGIEEALDLLGALGIERAA